MTEFIHILCTYARATDGLNHGLHGWHGSSQGRQPDRGRDWGLGNATEPIHPDESHHTQDLKRSREETRGRFASRLFPATRLRTQYPTYRRSSTTPTPGKRPRGRVRGSQAFLPSFVARSTSLRPAATAQVRVSPSRLTAKVNGPSASISIRQFALATDGGSARSETTRPLKR